MSEEPAQNSSAHGLTRGFLFADLRGYTAFLESNGAAAASQLLDRYRAIVRNAVAQRQGAEVKTEGDSFYVVFPAVSSAVLCGLDILAAAGNDATTHQEAPIAVGIGVHAGETIETHDGYVGTAVNVAARICALAGPGQLLVTDTVRTLTGSVLPVSFEPRGRRKLKGVKEPVSVYLVAAGSAPSHLSRSWGRRRLGFGGVAIVGMLVAVGLGTVWLASGAGTTTRTDATPTAPGQTDVPSMAAGSTSTAQAAGSPKPLVAGRLAAGTYVTHRFQPPLVISLPEGWSAAPESPDYLAVRLADKPDDLLSFHKVLRASADGCFTLSQPIASSVGLYDWLEKQPDLAVGTLVHRSVYTVPGVPTQPTPSTSTAPGWQVDIEITGGSDCGAARGTGIYLFPTSEAEISEIDPAKQWLFIRQGLRARILVANLPTGDVTLVEQTLVDADFGEFSAQATDLLDHIAFISP